MSATHRLTNFYIKSDSIHKYAHIDMRTCLFELDFYCFSLLYQFMNNKLACHTNKTSGIESDDCHHRRIVFVWHKLTSRDHRSSISIASCLYLFSAHSFRLLLPPLKLVHKSIEKSILKSSFFSLERKNLSSRVLLRKWFFHSLPTQFCITKESYLFFVACTIMIRVCYIK
jgi:hypothetical protein